MEMNIVIFEVHTADMVILQVSARFGREINLLNLRMEAVHYSKTPVKRTNRQEVIFQKIRTFKFFTYLICY